MNKFEEKLSTEKTEELYAPYISEISINDIVINKTKSFNSNHIEIWNKYDNRTKITTIHTPEFKVYSFEKKPNGYYNLTVILDLTDKSNVLWRDFVNSLQNRAIDIVKSNASDWFRFAKKLDFYDLILENIPSNNVGKYGHILHVFDDTSLIDTKGNEYPLETLLNNPPFTFSVQLLFTFLSVLIDQKESSFMVLTDVNKIMFKKLNEDIKKEKYVNKKSTIYNFRPMSEENRIDEMKEIINRKSILKKDNTIWKLKENNVTLNEGNLKEKESNLKEKEKKKKKEKRKLNDSNKSLVLSPNISPTNIINTDSQIENINSVSDITLNNAESINE